MFPGGPLPAYGKAGRDNADSRFPVMNLPSAFLEQYDEPFGFMNFASIGAMSVTARRRMEEAGEIMSGRHGPLLPAALEMLSAAVGRAAALLGFPPERVVLTANTSAGLFAVAFGLAGGTVLVPAAEFPGNLYPWSRAEQAGRIRTRFISPQQGRITPGLFAEAMDGGVSALAFSAVDYHTGFRCDLAGIREAAGEALVVVDAVQALGVLDMPWEAADVVAAGGHKWLRAGMGVGIMAVSERALERLQPTLTGWLGVEDPLDTAEPYPHPPASSAARFAMGTPPLTAAAGLSGALEAMEGADVKDIEAAALERSRAVAKQVRRAGGEVLVAPRSAAERSGIVTFRPAGESAADAHRRLADAGFLITERGGCLRVSPHATTHPGAPAALGEALRVPGRRRWWRIRRRKP